MGLPHNDADFVIFSVEHYLPVRGTAENADSFFERVLPSLESLSKLNPNASLSLQHDHERRLSHERLVGKEF